MNNTRIFNGDATRPISAPTTIHISKGRIASIGLNIETLKNCMQIDTKGAIALPGFIDLHTHLTLPGSPPSMPAFGSLKVNATNFLYAGVTTVLDLYANISELINDTNALIASQNPAPRIFHAGKAFTANNGHPAFIINAYFPWPFNNTAKEKTLYQLPVKENLKSLVLENKKYGATVTKVFIDALPQEAPVISKADLKELAYASKQVGLPVFAHIGSERNINDALDAGIKVFVHAPYKERISDKIVARLKREKAVIMPTMVVWQSVAYASRAETHFNKLDRTLIDPEVYFAYQESKGQRAILQHWYELVDANQKNLFENVKRMKEAGIEILAASDSPNLGLISGGGIIKEIELLVKKCDYSVFEAIEAATLKPGRLLQHTLGIPGLGKIETGAQADILVVPDFTKDLSKLYDIEYLIVNGRQVQRRNK